MKKLNKEFVLKNLESNIENWNTKSINSVQVKAVESIEVDGDTLYIELTTRIRSNENYSDSGVTLVVDNVNNLSEAVLEKQQAELNAELSSVVETFDFWTHAKFDIIPKQTPMVVFTDKDIDVHIVAAYKGRD